nr:phosphate propanoyltransferase [Fusibacter ferrireducens]
MGKEQLYGVIQDEIIKKLGVVPVGVSNRHVHLSQSDFEVLFGKGKSLTFMKALKQPGQYASQETVVLKGPKGELRNVRILGPFRRETQVELSIADSFVLGIKIEVRESGKIEGSAGVSIIGPCGETTIDKGVIAAFRHIHMPQAYADQQNYVDGQIVHVASEGIRSMLFKNVMVRVSDQYELELHLDVEEANAAGIKNGDYLKIIR